MFRVVLLSIGLIVNFITATILFRDFSRIRLMGNSHLFVLETSNFSKRILIDCILLLFNCIYIIFFDKCGGMILALPIANMIVVMASPTMNIYKRRVYNNMTSRFYFFMYLVLLYSITFIYRIQEGGLL